MCFITNIDTNSISVILPIPIPIAIPIAIPIVKILYYQC